MEARTPPSRFSEELKKFVGKRVNKIVRYSWWPKQDISGECGIEREFSFSLTAGPLEVIFDDDSSIGIASDPSLNSVIAWNERAPGGSACVSSPLAEDVELYPVNSDDEVYAGRFWREFINKKLIGFSILKKQRMSFLENELPSELGLCFIFEGNLRFIASHGLHDGSDDFSVLLSDQVATMHHNQLMEVVLR
jgi:hypothetical protein